MARLSHIYYFSLQAKRPNDSEILNIFKISKFRVIIGKMKESLKQILAKIITYFICWLPVLSFASIKHCFTL